MAEDEASAEQLKSVAARLTDIASLLAQDAEDVTTTVRAMAPHAHDIATLSNDLANAANQVDSSVQAQAEILAKSKRSMDENEPAIDALGQAIETVSSMSGVIDKIAGQIRLLSFNARIEAARSADDHEGDGFAAVAVEMAFLSEQARTANEEIRLRAKLVAAEVNRARQIVLSGSDLLSTQTDMIGILLDMSGRLRETASKMTTITADAASKIDDVATGIGRVGSTAITAKVLARQISKIADQATRLSAVSPDKPADKIGLGMTMPSPAD